jgi:lipopolysaccharide-induced tumor necrosis factor-alpha factor
VDFIDVKIQWLLFLHHNVSTFSSIFVLISSSFMTIVALFITKDDRNQPYQPQPGSTGYAMPMGSPVVIFGEAPMSIMCPNCRQQMLSRVEKKSGTITWLICLGIAFLGGILGCCLIPFYVDAAKVTDDLTILMMSCFLTGHTSLLSKLRHLTRRSQDDITMENDHREHIFFVF